jgi:hypothetical protein
MSCFKKTAQCVPWGHRYNVLLQIAQGIRKWDEKLDSRADKKGAKKLVSSNCAKILE